MSKKGQQRNKYDWKVITREFLKGPFATVKEYVRWNDQRKKNFPTEVRPGRDSILKMSAKMNWPMLKTKADDRVIAKVLDEVERGAVSDEAQKALQELAESRTLLNRATLKMVIHYANNPEQIRMRGNISEVINDLKRGLGMTTREQQANTGVGNTNLVVQNQIGESSFRTTLEGKTGKDLDQLDGQTVSDLDLLEKGVPDEELAFLDTGDDDDSS